MAYVDNSTDVPNDIWIDVEQIKWSIGNFDASLFMIGLKITIGILGVLGNATVYIVLSTMKPEKVNFLIGSQATIDLLASMCMVADAFTNALYPQPPPQQLIRGYLFCLFWRWSTVMFCLFTASTYNLIAISIERYLSIIHPMWYRTKFTKRTAMILGAVTWLLSPIMQMIFAATQEFYSNGKCLFISNPAIVRIIIGIVLFFWDFLTPSFIMGFCSIRICIAILHHSKEENAINSTSKDQKRIRRKTAPIERWRRNRNVAVTFIVVVVAYILCWSTDQFLFLQRNLTGHKYLHRDALYHFSNAMAMLNSAINPLIYLFCMKKYRDKLIALLRGLINVFLQPLFLSFYE